MQISVFRVRLFSKILSQHWTPSFLQHYNYSSGFGLMWGGTMADHSLKGGSGGFEVKLVESFKTDDKDAIAPDGRNFSSMCRIGWTVKDRNEF